MKLISLTARRALIRYGHLYNVAGSPNFFGNLADEGCGPTTVQEHNAALGYTQTLGTATVLELRAGVSRALDAALGGWQANGILTLASGVPPVFSTAANNSYTFGGGQYPVPG